MNLLLWMILESRKPDGGGRPRLAASRNFVQRTPETCDHLWNAHYISIENNNLNIHCNQEWKGQHSQFYMFFDFHSAQNKCHINHSRSLQKLLHNCYLFTAAVAKVIVARAWATFWAQTWTPTHLRWEKVQPRLFLKVFELELIFLSYFCELSKSVLLLAVMEVRLNTWDYCIHGR